MTNVAGDHTAMDSAPTTGHVTLSLYFPLYILTPTTARFPQVQAAVLPAPLIPRPLVLDLGSPRVPASTLC